jgi:hypothetical protein
MRDLIIPFIPAQRIESAAKVLLDEFERFRGVPVTPPIPVEDMVEKMLGLDLEYAENLESMFGYPDLLGATELEEGRIWIDSSLLKNPRRMAFTVAHECGHWRLHKPLFDALKKKYPATADALRPTIECRSSEKRAPEEWQADRFAAALLMPEEAVRKTVMDLCKEDFAHVVNVSYHRTVAKPSLVEKELEAFLAECA